MFNAITKLFVDARTRLTREETGATAVEYGLIVGLIAVVIVTAVALLGTNLQGFFDDINDKLK
ncbi:MAG: Flp/Fap pilin component [Rhodoglobus sp.]|jgi:pilus assembly protein Flp/PilA|nr:Flp/Fap pilin component [Rhodoglobus sp.]